MPNKSIPTLGDSNWGIPLNAHLAQLQNPTNGGINTFEQFSGRPTTLTLDDQGKTYLYTQTGNIHQWTGNAWKVLNESVINVKDYGAVGDGVADDTLAIQGLLDKNSNTSNKSLFFPEGLYLMNVTTKYQVPNFLGIGNYSTRIESYTPSGWAIRITYNNNWQPFEIRDISFTGSTSRTKNGIQFGHEIYSPNDELCAGLRMVGVLFDGLDTGIFKRYGNIGNYFESCDFRDCNYHYKAVGNVSPRGIGFGMHSGCDTFYKCEMDNSQICSIYIDGNNAAVNGQHIFRDCIFQYNKGFSLYVKNYDNENQLNACVGLKVENCWLEGNASASQVNIDGFLVTPRNLYFNKANAIFENCETQNIELIHSKITCINSGLKNYVAGDPNQEGIIKDNFSSIILNEFSFTKDIPYYVKNPQYIKQSIPTSVYCISAQRNNVCYTAKNLIFSDSYSTRENIFCLGVSGVNVGKLLETELCLVGVWK